MAPDGAIEPVMGAAQGAGQPPPQGARHGQQQLSQQQPLAKNNSISPVRVEIKRFIPGFLSCGIET